MKKFEITLKGVSTNDTKTIAALHKITGQSLVEVKNNLANGLPVFAKELSFAETYGNGSVIGKLIDFFKENAAIDAVISRDGKEMSLREFVEGRDETMADNDKTESFDNEALMELYMAKLREYCDEIEFELDEDADIQFEDSGEFLFLGISYGSLPYDMIDEDEKKFFHVCCPEFLEIKSEDEKAKALKVANNVNACSRCGRIILLEKDNGTFMFADIGSFFNDENDLALYFIDMKDILLDMIKDFRKGMKKQK